MPAKTQMNDAFAAQLESLMPKSQPWLIAVSGGLDSMVLLHFLKKAGYESLKVCHVNHQLRGQESDLDAAFVAEVSEGMGFKCDLETVDVEAAVAERKESLEAVARDLRYAALAKVAERRGCSNVVTAHHADDQVETVLMNFFRGSGDRGLSGMDQISSRVIRGTTLNIFRPLLQVTREELENYASENEVSFREDESNFDDFALRNRVRNTLMPTLNEVFQRDVRGAVLRAAELSRINEAWMAGAEGELPRRENGLDVSALREMDAGRRDRVLLSWLRECGVPDCGHAEVSRVAEILLSDERPAKVNLPNGHHVRRRAGILFLESPPNELE
ncbi:MAG: tRNA lysidine(34) synthetase TilS [Verrucomicrobiales bacterium]|nr:tRNA lysidine(34) synthetase TilS [Verrucomicrobiales bacterium]